MLSIIEYISEKLKLTGPKNGFKSYNLPEILTLVSNDESIIKYITMNIGRIPEGKQDNVIKDLLNELSEKLLEYIDMYSIDDLNSGNITEKIMFVIKKTNPLDNRSYKDFPSFDIYDEHIDNYICGTNYNDLYDEYAIEMMERINDELSFEPSEMAKISKEAFNDEHETKYEYDFFSILDIIARLKYSAKAYFELKHKYKEAKKFFFDYD